MTTRTTSTTAVTPYRKPPTPKEAMHVGALMQASGFFSDTKMAAQAAVKIVAGRELGLGDVASMLGVYIVKGRVTFSANAMAAVLQQSGRFRFRVKKHSRKGCEIEFFERDPDSGKWESVGLSPFDEEDAKLAGLLSGDNYKKYPRNMYYARAMSNGCKWYAPSAFTGYTPYLPDELDASAQADEEGNYAVDGKVVQSVDVEVLPPTGTPLRELFDLVEETFSDPNALTTHYGVASLKDLSDDQVANALQLLRAKKSAL